VAITFQCFYVMVFFARLSANEITKVNFWLALFTVGLGPEAAEICGLDVTAKF